ncbi:putative oRF16-lacZ fusion protein [Burkholderia mallei]|nr:putative oRF16-lacZ fusion protein [Burkholderia mallei]
MSLVATQEHSKETAGDKPEEGGDDVKSSWPLWVGLHTSYNGRNRGSPTREGEPIPENRS